jgi:hypothetical protein
LPACDLAFPLVSSGLGTSRRAMEITKRRRGGAGFAPALRPPPCLRLRAVPADGVFFRCGINIRPVKSALVQRNRMILLHEPVVVGSAQLFTCPLNIRNCEHQNARRLTRRHANRFWGKFKNNRNPGDTRNPGPSAPFGIQDAVAKSLAINPINRKRAKRQCHG